MDLNPQQLEKEAKEIFRVLRNAPIAENADVSAHITMLERGVKGKINTGKITDIGGLRAHIVTGLSSVYHPVISQLLRDPSVQRKLHHGPQH